jgi:hypothetical protein
METLVTKCCGSTYEIFYKSGRQFRRCIRCRRVCEIKRIRSKVEDKRYEDFPRNELIILLEHPGWIRTRYGCDCDTCLDYELKLIREALGGIDG